MDFAEEFSMHECRKEEVGWESSVKLALMREEEIGMYLEEREGRKRKWDGKTRRDSEERDHRKVPPKKIMAALGDMGGSGTSSSSSHNMSPGWQVNDLDLDLPTELSMNEALLSLPSLAVFKQEAPSPTGAPSPPRRAWPRRDDRQITSMVVDARDGADEGPPPLAAALVNHHGSPELPPSLPPSMLQMNGYHSPSAHDNKTAGLLMCSPAGSLDGFLAPGPPRAPAFRDDTRFQYVLAAATSIATKQNEETLTYLNQGQPYEIKLKKLGDLSHYKGKILKSVIKICFHERRLQYMEREQIAQWHQDRPGDRIVEVDVPLSYGVTRVEQPAALNALHVYWDPTKDVGVYIKVNCISTEFTAKKHGGEKGVPFRIQVETSLASDDHRLHAAACQIKVFKLKGADRKHKQDREKVLRRPRGDPDKYQPGCDATVLTTLSNDALLPPPSLITASPPYSPEMCVSPKSVGSPMGASKNPPAILAASNQMKPLYCPDSEMKARSPGCPSPGAILPDLPQPADDPDSNGGLSKDASIAETQAWLVNNRFSQYAATFANFTGADLLRLSREDATALCGLADGLRLLNALVGRRIAPRLTVYVRADDSVYSALYLAAPRAASLAARLAALADKEVSAVFVRGPRGARVRLTDELVRHLPDHSTYRLEQEGDRALVLCPENN